MCELVGNLRGVLNVSTPVCSWNMTCFNLPKWEKQELAGYTSLAFFFRFLIASYLP